jgi:hypothetical protein
LFVAVIVVVIARAAADFRGIAIQNGNDGVIRDPPALDAKIVDDIAKAKFFHDRLPED